MVLINILQKKQKRECFGQESHLDLQELSFLNKRWDSAPSTVPSATFISCQLIYQDAFVTLAEWRIRSPVRRHRDCAAHSNTQAWGEQRGEEHRKAERSALGRLRPGIGAEIASHNYASGYSPHTSGLWGICSEVIRTLSFSFCFLQNIIFLSSPGPYSYNHHIFLSLLRSFKSSSF